MADYRLETDIWVLPIKYAKEVGISKQLLNYWMKTEQIEVKELPEYNLRLVKRGSEKVKRDKSVTNSSPDEFNAKKFKSKNLKSDG